MKLNETIAAVVRETGWTLEYIRSQPVNYIQMLLNEILFQKSLESYQEAYNSAMIVCVLINDKARHYKPEDIIGERPERRTMENHEQLGETPQLETIILPNGKQYKLWPLTINMMCAVQGKFGKETIASLGKGEPDFEMLRMICYLRAQKCHPEVTLEDAGEMAMAEIDKMVI